MASSSIKERVHPSRGQTMEDEEHHDAAKLLTNTTDCPLRNQTGDEAICDFTHIIAQLSSEQRAAFEAEQAARRAEIELYLAVGEEKAVGRNTRRET